MKGLLKKDYYTIIFNCRFYLIMYAALLVLNILSSNSSGVFTNVIVYIIPSTLVISLLGFDEKSKWESYINELPLTRKDYVNAKYMIGTLFILVGIITGLLGSMIFNKTGATEVFVMSIIASCLSFAFTVPIYFRFGSNMGRIAYYLVIMVASMMISVLNNVDINSIIPNLSPYVLCVISIVIYVVSWLLSIIFYQKRMQKLR